MNRERVATGMAMAALVMGACASRMARVERALKRYEADLRLAAEPETPSPVIGQPVGIRLDLENRTLDQVVSACVGVSRQYQFLAVPLRVREGRAPVDQQGSLVDHPYCDRRFSLSPGEKLSWREEVLVRDIGAGQAELRAAVQIVHPTDCDQYGCYDTMLSAPAALVVLRREQQ